jgi:hypothetical protein
MEIKKAVKTKQRLRLAIDGVSGSGKTYTALAVASGMGGPIIVIDSEHGSASLYADRFAFDTIELSQFQIEDYIAALEMAASGNEGNAYPVAVVDSTSHAWDALVERVERIADQKFGGNTFRGWGEGTPLQKKLVEALLNYPGHVIVTCRSKTEYSVEKNKEGTTTIRKVGTAAVQRQGFEYEFTMTMSMNANHVGMVTKDRTSKFQDQFIEKPGKKLGEDLIKWLAEGVINYPLLFKEKVAEIGNILKSEYNGMAIFSEMELNSARETIRPLLAVPNEKNLAVLEDLLTANKIQLQNRMVLKEPVPLATPSPLIVPAVSPTAAAAPASPVPVVPALPAASSGTEGKSLTEEFKKRISEKESTANTQSVAPEGAPGSMYSVDESDNENGVTPSDDDFEDDIPFETEDGKAVKANAELDIF